MTPEDEDEESKGEGANCGDGEREALNMYREGKFVEVKCSLYNINYSISSVDIRCSVRDLDTYFGWEIYSEYCEKLLYHKRREGEKC